VCSKKDNNNNKSDAWQDAIRSYSYPIYHAWQDIKMHAKAFEQSKPFIAIRKQKKTIIYSINKQITKPSPRVPSGVTIMSHPC